MGIGEMWLHSFWAVCVLLAGSTRDSHGRPMTAENEAGGGGFVSGPKREQHNCRVDDFRIQSNFQLDMYVGTWYHLAHLQSANEPYQRRSHYSLVEDGRGLSMRMQKVSEKMNCRMMEFEAMGLPMDSDMPGKLQLSVPMRPLMRVNYWVLYTDYQNMAVIYSCDEVTEAGVCKPGKAKTWVIGRNPQLTDEQLQHAKHLLSEVCIDPSTLEIVSSGCDSFLGIVADPESTQNNLEGDKPTDATRSCVVDEFSVQSNFNVEKYIGTWYVVAHVRQSHHLYQRRSVYDLMDDGSILMTTQRVSRDGQCNYWEFEAIGYLPDISENPAKLLLNISSMDMKPQDYWVLYADYDAYAIIYSCREQSATDGTCIDTTEHLWVLSRRMSLTLTQRSHLMKILQDVCIDPYQMEDVPADCDEVLDMSTGDGKDGDNIEEYATTEEIEISCIVDDFQVQENFVIEKFLGEWYSFQQTDADIFNQKTSMASLVFRPSKDKTQAHMDVLVQSIKHHTIDGDAQCLAESQRGQAWVTDIAPAKFRISFTMVTRVSDNGQTESQVMDFWILSTDYTNYAIAYTCHVVSENGTCEPEAEELWVLSRTPSLKPFYQYNIDITMESVCMNMSDLITNTESCKTANTKVKQDKLTPIDPVGPAELTSKRICDPVLAEYGCCLLEDKAADGPNYHGCPRVPPPIAGQGLSGGPQEIRDPSTCNKKIICKMWCKNGFAKNAYGCEICQCAVDL